MVYDAITPATVTVTSALSGDTSRPDVTVTRKPTRPGQAVSSRAKSPWLIMARTWSVDLSHAPA
jgi:hypothetical protein